MFDVGQIKALVLETKDSLLNGEGKAEKSLLVARVLKGVREDEDFAAWAQHQVVTRYVERVIRDVKHREDTLDKQSVLPGFEHLQQEYCVVRPNGESAIVKTPRMEREDFSAKADQHRKMGDGHHAHADELIRYMEQLYG